MPEFPLEQKIIGEFPPERYKVISKTSSELQLVLSMGHLNPEVHADPVYSKPNKVLKQSTTSNVQETTSTVGITTAKGSNLTSFYEGMITMINMGLVTGVSIAEITDLRQKMGKVFPEDCDMAFEVTVIEYPDEKASAQALENIMVINTEGIENMKVPGVQGNMTMSDVLKNPIVREKAGQYGVSTAQMDEMLSKMAQATVELRTATAKSGNKYEKGKFGPYDAVFFRPPAGGPGTTKAFDHSKRVVKHKPGAGGGIDERVVLPENAYDREAFPVDGHVLQGIRMGRYVVSGGMLSSYSYMPSASHFCQSLKKFKTETKTMKEGDMTFIDNFVVPEYSNLGSEGYLNREEIGAILLGIGRLLSRDI